MSVRIEPFHMSDLLTMDVQETHAPLLPSVWRNFLALGRLMEGTWSWTAWSSFGVPVASCGILPDGTAWAFLSSDLRRYMIPVTRAVKMILETHLEVEGPVHASIDSESPDAVRWATALGFSNDDGVWTYGRTT